MRRVRARVFSLCVGVGQSETSPSAPGSKGHSASRLSSTLASRSKHVHLMLA